jgi:hypothetical protein
MMILILYLLIIFIICVYVIAYTFLDFWVNKTKGIGDISVPHAKTEYGIGGKFTKGQYRFYFVIRALKVMIYAMGALLVTMLIVKSSMGYLQLFA